MEKRALLAIALSVAVLLVWQILFAPPSVPPPPESPPAGAVAPGAVPSGAPSPGGSVPSGPTSGGAADLARPTLPRLRATSHAAEVSTPLFRARLEADGSVRSWVLRYRGSKELLVDERLGALTVSLTRAGRPAEVVALTPREPSLTLGGEQPTGVLAFTGRTQDGLRVEKRLRFGSDSYRIEVQLRVEGDQPVDALTGTLSWTSPVALMAVAGTVERVGDESLVVAVGEGKERKEWAFVLAPDTRVLRESQLIGLRAISLDDGATVTFREVEGRLVAKSVEVKAGKKPPRDAAPLTYGEGPDRMQLLGRILVGWTGRPENIEPPPAALKDGVKGAELKEPQLLAASLMSPGPRWIALENDYFIATLIPAAGGQVLRARTKEWTEIGLAFPEARLGPGQPWEAAASLYVGPKEWNRLAALEVGLEQAQARNYGHFLWLASWGAPPIEFPWMPMWWFCVPLLWLMNFFATQLPGQNFGVAIILLTVLVKIAFYPLTHKSMMSMKAMQALQPQLNALRAKHKAEPQRFQREQMELFRKHKVNPMGGCLPMIVQIPIFYALYLTLQFSVELQGAPFVLWITDLSRKDPYYVLPILMGVSMLVQQKMTPTVGDPRQANVMLIMPVIFTFMFLEFPTGLVLYWFVNNILSIAQQYVIDQTVLRRKATAVVDKTGREPRKA